MKKAILILTLLFTFSYLPQTFAQTEDYSTARDAMQGMSGLLESFDELKSSQEVTETLSKIGKAAKSFALAGAAFDIGLALFGGDDEQTLLLKEIKNMLTKVQTELKSVKSDLKAGVKDIKNNDNFLSGQEQVFLSLSNVEACLGLVNNLLECRSPSCQEAAKNQIYDHQNLFAELSRDFINIRKSILGETASVGILDAAIAQSYGDMSLVSKLSNRLLGAAISSVYARNMYYSVSDEGNPSQLAQHRKLIFKEFERDIDHLQRGIDKAMKKCLRFSTVKEYAKAGVNQIVDKYEWMSNKQEFCDIIKQDLAKKWPEPIVIVVAMNKKSEGKYYRFWNNFNDHNIPAAQVNWETKSKHGAVLVISRPEYLRVGAKYDQYMSANSGKKFHGRFDALWEATRIYRDYWRDGNLHRYGPDGGANKPFASMPFFHVGEVMSKKEGISQLHSISGGQFINWRKGYQGHDWGYRATTMIFPSVLSNTYYMGANNW